jgi:integrase
LSLSDTTIQKYHKTLRKVVSEAIKKGFIDKSDNPYESFVSKAKTPKKECLTIDEIKKIENLKIPEKMTGLDKAKDMFLFSVYTGNRFSDMIQISNNTIKFNTDGIYFERISKKTKRPEVFKLRYYFRNDKGNSKPEIIIEKYRDFLSIKPFDISLQQYNKHLKIIGKMAKIDKKLTSHIARHTFGTYMIDKMSTPALQKLMGHSDINTTMIYVHMREEMAQDELKNVKKWD